VCFLSETHLDRAKVDDVRRRAGFDHMLVYESDGKEWWSVVDVEGGNKISRENITKYYIDVVVEEEGGWRFTGIYGEPDWNQKARTWEAIRSIKQDLASPWLIMGDFNEILYNSEKKGERPRSQRQLQAFHDVLSECELNDMGFTGDIYTWQRGQIRERLDRAVANIQWSNLYPQATLINSDDAV
jgi:hypothetical protein